MPPRSGPCAWHARAPSSPLPARVSRWALPPSACTATRQGRLRRLVRCGRPWMLRQYQCERRG